jgi:hypothetical protein
MSNWLSDDEMKQVEGAEQHESPIPTRVVSNGEFNPMPQTGYQRQVEERIAALGDRYGRSRGMNRRDFLRSASGMAVAFLAMNEVYGGVFDVSEAEAADLEAAGERAARTAGQLIFDDQTHFNPSRADRSGPLRSEALESRHARRNGHHPRAIPIRELSQGDLPR